MTTNAQKARWDAEHTKQIILKLNRNTDADILARLAAQPAKTGGKQGYIKRLIRSDCASADDSNSIRGTWINEKWAILPPDFPVPYAAFATCSACKKEAPMCVKRGKETLEIASRFCPYCGLEMDL